MKPFDLNLAKAGHPVCNRRGEPVRILCFDKKDKDYPIVGLIDRGDKEEYGMFTEKGKYGKALSFDSIDDLFMASMKKTGWINVYKRQYHHATGHTIYDTKEKAKDVAKGDSGYVDTIEITWDE